ncbi:hypothetical protein ACFV1N_46045 [Streptosporangium canum]|uniref:hypothetical protein n=1 Tax=Streptosporangium canum TaxID=324952 RepID=UPI0036BE3102
MTSPRQPQFRNVAEAAAWARQILAASSPRAAEVIRRHATVRRGCDHDYDPTHWARIDALAQVAADQPVALLEPWQPEAGEQQPDEREPALARARTRARQERTQRKPR